MATTIVKNTLKVTITEDIILNGAQQGATNVLNLTDIHEVSKRIVTITTSEVEIIAISSAITSGTFLETDVRYIRITNLDTAYNVLLTFKNKDNNEFVVKVDPGQSFIYNGDLDGGVVDTMDASASAITVSMNDLVNITADAEHANGTDIEVFVACKKSS